ncbi:MAG: hypothetical protein V4543_00860 [Bacteroidota bacterium]
MEIISFITNQGLVYEPVPLTAVISPKHVRIKKGGIRTVSFSEAGKPGEKDVFRKKPVQPVQEWEEYYAKNQDLKDELETCRKKILQLQNQMLAIKHLTADLEENTNAIDALLRPKSLIARLQSYCRLCKQIMQGKAITNTTAI